ncbi:hypothetical protein D3C85_184500 [compost metagenome]
MRQAFRYGLVLGRAIQQQAADALARIAPFAQCTQGRQHGRLDAFGGAAVEHQAAVAHAQQAAGAPAHAIHHGLGLQSRRMGAAGIAIALLHRLPGGGNGGRQHASGGIAVEVDFFHDGSPSIL